ncbi:MAG: hypothetical protein WBI27_20475, partial [Thermoanaerobaculia bacterium]
LSVATKPEAVPHGGAIGAARLRWHEEKKKKADAEVAVGEKRHDQLDVARLKKSVLRGISWHGLADSGPAMA